MLKGLDVLVDHIINNHFLKEHGPVVITKHGHIFRVLVLDSQHNSQNQNSLDLLWIWPAYALM